MSKVNEIICIQCPLGCNIRISFAEGSDKIKLNGCQCKEGYKYAEQEYRSPVRVLTTTLRTIKSVRPVIPVRTDRPIKKELIKKCTQFLLNVRVHPPLYLGDIVVSNILNTGSNIICTDELDS